MTYRQFVIRFAIGYFLLLALLGIFNRIVDPSWYYRDIEIQGFNAVKPEYLSFEREVKPALLARDKPEAIILGSSYAEIGFDPVNPYFTDRGNLKSMNFAFARASWAEVQCDFEFAVTHSHIKRALIGIHPGNLPISNCEKDFASIERFNPVDILFTYSALEYSIKTIKKQRASDITHTYEGMFFYNRDRNPFPFFQEDLKARAAECRKNLAAGSSSNGSANLLDLSGLQRMIRTAREHNVELVLFAYPKHAYLLEMDNLCGGQDAEWQAMKRISEFIDSESGGQVKAWQFFGYNDITAERVRNTRGYWQDAKHFNFEAGNIMLDDMFNKTRSKPVLARPLAADYADFLREREEYLQRHPEFSVNLSR
ncbi:MAG: hypothetical protein ACOY9D_08640 [Pseudomonadota bacterium]